MVTNSTNPSGVDRRAWRLRTLEGNPHHSSSYKLVDEKTGFSWVKGERFNVIVTEVVTGWLHLANNMEGDIPPGVTKCSQVNGNWIAECVGVFWDLGEPDEDS